MCDMPYTCGVSLKLDVLKTAEFEDWLNDQQPKLRTMLLARLDLVSIGHFGNHKRFEGLIELKWINGTRVYTFMWGNAVVVALYGGNKNGQSRDIKKAEKISDEVLEGTRILHK